MFNAYIAISPSLWWDDEFLNKTALEKLSNMQLSNKYYYFSVGAEENPVIIKDAHTFLETMKNNAPSNLNWKFDYLQNEDHGSQGLIALYKGVKNLYEGWSLQYQEVISGGLDLVGDHYSKLSARFGYKIEPSEGEVNNYAYWMIRSKKNEEAIKFCEYNVKRHPNSSNVYDSLGEALEAAGRDKEALKNYKLALEKSTDTTDENKDFYKKHFDDLSKKMSGKE